MAHKEVYIMQNEKLKILLITGRVTLEHNYRQANEMLRTLLESTGRFEVKITEEFRGSDKGNSGRL